MPVDYKLVAASVSRSKRDRTEDPFRARVLAAVRRIPTGRVATYGDVAAIAGHPRACRAVGNIMRDCRDTRIPCHRVVAAAGRLGGYGGNLQLKRELLRAEGVLVFGQKIREFADRRWVPPSRRRATRGANGLV